LIVRNTPNLQVQIKKTLKGPDRTPGILDHGRSVEDIIAA